MNRTYRLVRSQYKRLADTLNALGLASVIGSVGDAVVNDVRPDVDRVGIAFGLALLTLSVHLSRWERSATIHSKPLTHSKKRG